MAPLKVDTAYFYPKENAERHKTKKFEAVNDEKPEVTIVRRGQPFSGVLRFDRPYNEKNDMVQLVFTLGDKPKMDTQGSVVLRHDVVVDKHAWSGKIDALHDKDVVFQISTPVTLPVGSWNLRVVTRLRSSDERNVYNYNQDIYILFNPWEPEDQTYMEDSQLLEEYVLNDVGKLYMGPPGHMRGRAWLFGQFDAVVLPACMFVLDKAGIPFHLRGDPVRLSRAISRIVNFNDDDGVVIGRWDGDYEDGTAPFEWSGSVDILAQYLHTQEPVRYGQCWVFAGVVNTVCRALGIPSRTVSNLVSAHDSNSSLTIDYYYSEKMEMLDYDPTNPETADMIWNYHLWNDVWMARPDLPAGFGGWQVIDATPQELSSGFFQCGPAPVAAIKQGVIGVGYDVAYMIAAVNADLMRWRVDPNAELGYSVVETDKYYVGRMILTKKPHVFDPIGNADWENIIDEYKHKEGTTNERTALMNGIRHSERAKRYYSIASKMQNDVKFKLNDIETVKIGENFNVILNINNVGNKDRRVTASIHVTSMLYNGVKAGLVKKHDFDVTVGSKKNEKINFLVKATEYLPKLSEYGNMKISVMAHVPETKQSWADDDDFQIAKPDIVIKFNEDLILGQTATAVLSFSNPLDHPLTGGIFRVNSTGIAGKTVKLPAADAPPLGTVTVEVPVQPNKLGTIHFVATFTSAELKDISGITSIEVFEG